MVSINGSMVPPHGFGQPRSIHQGQDGVIEVTFSGDGSSRKANINTKNGSQLYDKNKDKQYGKTDPDNRAVTSASDGDCKGLIYVHLWLDVDQAAKDGCDDASIQSMIQAYENAVSRHWKDILCPCPEKKPEKGDDESKKKDDDSDDKKEAKGCTFSVKLVWHAKKDSKSIPVKARCAAAGLSTPGVGIDVVPPNVGGAPMGEGEAAALYAHELGHQLFNTGDKAPFSSLVARRRHAEKPQENPAPWNLDRNAGKTDGAGKPLKPDYDNQGHNPDPKGIMRDTVLHGPLPPGHQPTRKEACILQEKYKLCNMDECCKEQEEEKKGAGGAKGSGQGGKQPGNGKTPIVTGKMPMETRLRPDVDIRMRQLE